MRILRVAILLPLLLACTLAFGQKSKYYGWWEHKGNYFAQDSVSARAIAELGDKYQLNITQLKPLSESEIQFYEDSFKLNYGISVLTGSGDSRDFRWFRTLTGVWKIDDDKYFRANGRNFTIRENNFTIEDEVWKDSIMNKTILFTAKNSDIIQLKFNDGAKAYGVFYNQSQYPYTWFYLEYGFGNIYTKFY